MEKQDRVILHSDFNNFYASVECLMQPSLRDKYVAVCGRQADRHGIVLAKNQAAKQLGVQTGEAIWQARAKCPDLVIVEPHFEAYMHYAKLARSVYMDFTDQIEPYGMDECWLDVTGSVKLLGSGMEMAETIRRRMEQEVGLTVSVGVSFNKIFAKLGSDLKKPNAVTQITRENFKEKLWHLDASVMLGVGRATERKLLQYGIHTLGQLANTEPALLQRRLGINGVRLWRWANGQDTSPVRTFDAVVAAKSVGRGSTCVSDLENAREVWLVLFTLSQSVARELRALALYAGGVAVDVKDSTLARRSFQCRLDVPIATAAELAARAFELFETQYTWQKPVRALTVRAICLVQANYRQLTLTDTKRELTRYRLESVMDELRRKYGDKALLYASLLCQNKMPGQEFHSILLPGMPGD